MASLVGENLIENIGNLTISNEKPNSGVNNVQYSNALECGLPLDDVYRLALSFYKEKAGKAVHFSYEDKLQLVAFSQQVSHGPFVNAEATLQPLGALDVVGKDRRLAWQKLGNLTNDQAKTGFIELLTRKCALFSTFIEAHRREHERISREKELERKIEEEARLKLEEEELIVREESDKQKAVKRQIQQALNTQTYEQFQKYAETQFPGDPEKQGSLIRQLQEQHYIQYMQQLQATANNVDNHNVNVDTSRTNWNESNTELNTTSDAENETDEYSLMAAAMWTKNDISDFKKSVSEAEGDGIVRVGHGETVTVRVPTHPQGSRLFWEFATDHYDIGFGVYFEYGTPASNQVSVHVSESDDEDPEEDDLDDENYDEEAIHTGDLESGATGGRFQPNKHLLSEVVPVYRRDCQSEVYAGSHQYPGEGVYLLKFDNSYSLWRSKTLYYRVFYTK